MLLRRSLLSWAVLACCTFCSISNSIANNGKHLKKITADPPRSYKSHLRTARGFGMVPIKDNLHLKSYVAKKKLSTVKCNKGCTIDKLSYSKPYLIPKANKVLNEISKTFNTKSKGSFTVTSITRTVHDQFRLTHVNNNARDGISAHNYGCSFDISYIRFNKKRGNNPRLEKILHQVLTEYQRKGKIFFIKEHHQKCYHVTVRS